MSPSTQLIHERKRERKREREREREDGRRLLTGIERRQLTGCVFEREREKEIRRERESMNNLQ